MDHHQVKVSQNYDNNNTNQSEEDEMDLRRGPWTVEEDFTLINYIAHHGEGRWNSLARCAGLKRTGKSCRLRWLNYLRPDVRRGNITLEEQLLILELHSRWGNRWSKIAQHLPGRTDNEIKNYWRTRVQKHAKQLKCDVNSKQFKDTMRYLWMPRLVERIQASSAGANVSAAQAPSSSTTTYQVNNENTNIEVGSGRVMLQQANIGSGQSYTPENSTESFGTPVSDLTECYNNYPGNYYPVNETNNAANNNNNQAYGDQSLISPTGYGFYNQGLDFVEQNSQWMDGGDLTDGVWNVDDVWFLNQQFGSNV